MNSSAVSQAHLKLGNHQEALEDSKAACRLPATCLPLKAVYRGAEAAQLLGHAADALEMAQRGLAMAPEVRRQWSTSCLHYRNRTIILSHPMPCARQHRALQTVLRKRLTPAASYPRCALLLRTKS